MGYTFPVGALKANTALESGGNGAQHLLALRLKAEVLYRVFDAPVASGFLPVFTDRLFHCIGETAGENLVVRGFFDERAHLRSDEIERAARARSNDRSAAGHAFDKYQAEGLIFRREHSDVGKGVEFGEDALGLRAHEVRRVEPQLDVGELGVVHLVRHGARPHDERANAVSFLPEFSGVPLGCHQEHIETFPVGEFACEHDELVEARRRNEGAGPCGQNR